ncbi:hypothetical protein Ancab_040672 [Ancistrocladus abbreviatus]
MDITNWSFMRANNVVTNEKLECMNRTAEALFAREEDVKTRIEVEKRDHRKRMTKEVGNWLMEVDELKNKKRRLEMDAEEGQFGRKKLKKQVEQLEIKMAELLKQGDFPNGVTLDDLSLLSLPLVTTQLKGEQFEKNLRTILSCCDDGVSIIGVWGVGGIGKTTLVTHIHDALCQKFKTCGNSRNVYWVTVSHGITTSNLQGKIAKAMHLDCLLNVEDQRQRAAMLSVALKKKENSVLILDDVWLKIQLENVGIPVGVNGCKLILTTRSLKVCRVMECQKTIRVECLSKEESWELFKDKLGGIKKLPLQAMDIAKLIAKECAGLPLAIKVVATSMRGIVDICEWRNALEELKKPTRQHEDMDKEVLKLLQLSYDRLNDVQLQNCFLHCALYYEDYSFGKDGLVESWIRDGLIEKIESRQKQIDKGHTMINRLLEACLLEAGHHSGVKMHDVLRDMAVKVARESHHFMIRAGEQLQDLPCEEEWTEDLRKISLMGTK